MRRPTSCLLVASHLQAPNVSTASNAETWRLFDVRLSIEDDPGKDNHDSSLALCQATALKLKCKVGLALCPVCPCCTAGASALHLCCLCCSTACECLQSASYLRAVLIARCGSTQQRSHSMRRWYSAISRTDMNHGFIACRAYPYHWLLCQLLGSPLMPGQSTEILHMWWMWMPTQPRLQGPTPGSG